jgi:hypothetical protein
MLCADDLQQLRDHWPGVNSVKEHQRLTKIVEAKDYMWHLVI